MIVFLISLVSLFFFAFVFLDLASHLPRLSGSSLKLNGLGFAFQTMANTVKRIFLVIIPPTLGFIAVYGNPIDVFTAVLVSHATASISFVLAYGFRRKLTSIFDGAILHYSEGNSLVLSFRKGFINTRIVQNGIDIRFSIHSIRRDILFPAVWIFFFYTGSGFLVNILAMISHEYSVIILQLTGALNALGTFVLAFVLDPKISRVYENGEEAESVFVTLFSAQMINVLFVSPVFYFLAALFFFIGFS